MGTQVEQEAANITPPLHGSPALVNIASVQAVPSATSKALTTLFGTGAVRNGHYLTLQADGAKCYVAFGVGGPGFATGSPQAGIIDDLQIGNGTAQCWPIPDGTSLNVRMVEGREMGTGIGASLMVKQLYETLYYKAQATCALRMYWSSLASEQGVGGEFKAP